MVEPALQPVVDHTVVTPGTNVTDSARLDIAMNGFWGVRFERCFLDVRVLNPHAPSNKSKSIGAVYRAHEKEKRRMYERRVLEIEQSSFTPLVFSVTGGMADECSLFYKRLASLVADKREQSYSHTLDWLRCCLSYTLLRSSIQCLRGARSTTHRAIHQPSDLILQESDLL